MSDTFIPKGINTYYNCKIKFLKGNGKIRLIVKDYKKVLGNNKEDIEVTDIEVNSNSISDNALVMTKNKVIRDDNIMRSRNKVKDLTFVNELKWKSFITLTFKDNINDIEYAYRKFNIWLKQMKRLCKKNDSDLYYLGVIEFQKRGAIHYHILTNLECNSIYLPLQKDKEKMFDVKYWNEGFTSVFDVVSDVDSNYDVSKYMCKYMTKSNNDSRLYGHKRYYHSYNLDKPIIINLLNSSMNYIALSHIIETNKYSITNEYHHNPRDVYEVEFDLKEYQFECDEYTIELFNKILLG